MGTLAPFHSTIDELLFGAQKKTSNDDDDDFSVGNRSSRAR